MNVLDIKAAVRARDGHKCVDCGLSGVEYFRSHHRLLDVHRLIPGSVYAVADCVTVCKKCHKARHKKTPRQTKAIKISADLLSSVRIVAATQGVSIREYLSNTLRPLVERDFEEMLEQGVALFRTRSTARQGTATPSE